MNFKPTLEQSVLESIAGYDAQSAKDILKRVHCKTASLYSTLKFLLLNQQIIAVGNGVKGQPIRYSLPPNPVPPTAVAIESKPSETEEFIF